VIAICSVGAGVAEAVVLSALAQIAATLSSGRPTGLGPIGLELPVAGLFVVALTAASARLLLQLLLAHLPARIAGEAQSELRAGLMHSYLLSAWSQRSREKEGHLQELMGAQSTHAGNAVLMAATGLASGLELLMLVGAAIFLSPSVSGLIIVVSTALFAGLRPLSRKVRRRAAGLSSASIEQAAGVAEVVRMAEPVQTFGVVDAQRLKILALTKDMEIKFISTRSLSRTVPVLYQSAVIFLLITGLWYLYVRGSVGLASLGAVVILLVRASAYGHQFQVAYQGLIEALPFVDMVAAETEKYDLEARSPGWRSIGPIRSIELSDATYEYNVEADPVLRGLTFSIEAGEAVGIVGPSGSGKSTLLQLLLRLRLPSQGFYRVNGYPANELDDAEWCRAVAFLPQEPAVHTGSVADNIRFWRGGIDQRTIEQAARLAHVHDEIVSMTKGYHTVIGQRADALSVGQRQRLCLARALAGLPEVLILDEPTSSLDLRSEELIQQSLGELRQSLTLIIVAHRPSLLAVCDRVMVIRDGHLEAFAAASELYESNGFFRQSVDLASARRVE
jgi:ABC-type multidrug transport system fused ATPase/permease subunit